MKNPDQMAGFREAFKIVYGQSLDSFYAHALPYGNYVALNPKLSDSTNSQASAFITDRLNKIKFTASARLESEMKTKLLAAAKEAEAKAAALKKTTITCIKGKLTKKVAAVKPLCPAGYKKK